MSWEKRIKIENWDEKDYHSLKSNSESVFVLSDSSAKSNTFTDTPLKFSELAGIGIRSQFVANTPSDLIELKTWMDGANDFIFGYISYEVKNLLEKLSSRNSYAIEFPKLHFVIPETVVMVKDGNITCHSHSRELLLLPRQKTKRSSLGTPLFTPSKSEYVSVVNELKHHIQQGDIYEINYCIEHGFIKTIIDPFKLYNELQIVSPAPYSCFVATDKKYLMCSSPERFMMKNGSRIISQPMKGTNRKSGDNLNQMNQLRNDAKEVAENVMITDLVRNDLSKSAVKGSVKVEELCGVYEFEHVNQMISTVSSELRKDVHPLDAILNAFPMGSMTGAPKVRAMELIDEYETFSRGLYSGTVGYFTPNMDFDFNVVIRGVLYSEEMETVTFPTGSAITINSDPEKEFEECLLKAEAMKKVLLNHAK